MPPPTGDFLKLRDKLGPVHGAMHHDLVPKLCCSKCSGKQSWPDSPSKGHQQGRPAVYDDLPETLGRLFRREMSANPPSNVPRWVCLHTSQGDLKALAFTVSRNAPAYAGRLPNKEIVEALATAVGHWGSCAEYLHNTVTHLEAKGIRDGRLWSLQAQVAERLAGTDGASNVTSR